MTGDRDILLERIERLERRHARVLRTLSLGAVTLGALGVVWLAGAGERAAAQGRAGAAPEIVASSIKLVDASGKPRAALYVQGQSAGFAISDPAGRTRLMLNADDESAKIAIVGANEGNPRILIVQSGDIQMLNMEDKTSAISLVHSQHPTVTLLSGKNSARLGFSESIPRGQRTPIVTPTLELEQEGRTVLTLPQPPPAPLR